MWNIVLNKVNSSEGGMLNELTLAAWSNRSCVDNLRKAFKDARTSSEVAESDSDSEPEEDAPRRPRLTAPALGERPELSFIIMANSSLFMHDLSM